MKKLFYLVTFFLVANFSIAQAPPEAFNYQAVARDNAGNILVNQNVSFRMSILKTTITGTVVYSELHFVTTDQYGMVALAIGTGLVTSGVFADIDWATDSYFFKTEFDQNGGGNFQVMGTTQLLSVPYALHAKTVDEHFDPQFPDGFDGVSIFINGTYTVPTGKNLILNTKTRSRHSWIFSPNRMIKLGSDTLWGNWHFIPENAVITSPSNNGLSNPESITGLLFDKKTTFVSISTQTNYLVPVGKKLYLFLPSWGDWDCDFYPGYFRINGNNYIAEPSGFNGNIETRRSEENLRLIILPAGSTIEYVDNPDFVTYGQSLCGTSVYSLPQRVFTGYLK